MESGRFLVCVQLLVHTSLPGGPVSISHWTCPTRTSRCPCPVPPAFLPSQLRLSVPFLWSKPLVASGLKPWFWSTVESSWGPAVFAIRRRLGCTTRGLCCHPALRCHPRLPLAPQHPTALSTQGQICPLKPNERPARGPLQSPISLGSQHCPYSPCGSLLALTIPTLLSSASVLSFLTGSSHIPILTRLPAGQVSLRARHPGSCWCACLCGARSLTQLLREASPLGEASPHRHPGPPLPTLFCSAQHTAAAGTPHAYL